MYISTPRDKIPLGEPHWSRNVYSQPLLLAHRSVTVMYNKKSKSISVFLKFVKATHTHRWKKQQLKDKATYLS